MTHPANHAQYAVLNQSAHAVGVLEWIQHHNILYEIHLNRTRFWVPLGAPLYTDFALRWAEHCHPVQDPEPIGDADC
jgi:hypothetical protein